MPTNSQIAVMVEVAQSGGIGLTAVQKTELPQIVADGLIEAAKDAAGPGNMVKYTLTSKGQTLLDKRGVGANES